MPEHPVILQTWQVRAAKDNRLRQIRLPVVPPKWWEGHLCHCTHFETGETLYYDQLCDRIGSRFAFPPIMPGDVLWAKETWQAHDVGWDDWCGGWEAGYPFKTIPKDKPEHVCLSYAADGGDGPWRPSTNMPRWASRFAFTVAAVRAQQAGDITDADAQACGAEPVDMGGVYPSARAARRHSHLQGYARHWDAQHGKRYPWAPGLWMWVVDLEPKGA